MTKEEKEIKKYTAYKINNLAIMEIFSNFLVSCWQLFYAKY